MWISAPTRRRRLIPADSSLPSWSDEVKDKKRRKGPSFSVVFSVILPRCKRRFCSFRRRFIGNKQMCCTYWILGAIFVAKLVVLSSFFDTLLLTPHVRLIIRKGKIISRPQCRTKAFPLIGFMVNSTKGSEITDRSGLEILYDFIEGEIFTPSFVINDRPLRSYLAFDDDELRRQNLITGRHKDIIQNEKSMQSNHCTRTAFHRVYNPNCNAFHEIDILFDPGNGFVG
jgi:hypothetical protein